MKKVGVVSCYFKNNYGSILQAYATRKFLDENNIPNETVNVSQLSDFSKGKRKYYISQAANLRFLKTKSGMIKLKGYARINRRLKRNFAVRNRRFEEFKRNFVLTRAFSTYSELHEYAKNTYSDVIVGSDQLWLPVNVVADYYTLNWVPAGRRGEGNPGPAVFTSPRGIVPGCSRNPFILNVCGRQQGPRFLHGPV